MERGIGRIGKKKFLKKEKRLPLESQKSKVKQHKERSHKKQKIRKRMSYNLLAILIYSHSFKHLQNLLQFLLNKELNLEELSIKQKKR